MTKISTFSSGSKGNGREQKPMRTVDIKVVPGKTKIIN